MGKSPMASELKDRQRIDGGIFAVAGMEIKTKANGEPYLSVQLADRSGTVEGKVWDCGTIPTEYQIGDAVEVSGTYNAQWKNVGLDSISRYDGEVNPDDFLARSRRDTEEMLAELEGFRSSVGVYKGLLDEVFEDKTVVERFPKWPAGQKIHHAYTGGLLEHTLAVASIAGHAAEQYEKAGRKVDKDLVLAGSLVHDIGKLEEMDCGLAITYTEQGDLYGHMHLGAEFVKSKINGLDGPAKITGRQEAALLHIILSHPGKKEWGAVTEPKTVEAWLVSVADLTDSKADRYFEVIEQQRESGEVVGGWDRYLRTRVWSPREE